MLKERECPEVRATGAQEIDRFSRGSDRQRGLAVVINKRTEGDLNFGNATDGDIFKKNVGKEVLLGL